MKKSSTKTDAHAAPRAENVGRGEIYVTDLNTLMFTKSLLELQGRFSQKNVAEPTAYLDAGASELVVLDQEQGSPGWTLETRIPCEVRGSWAAAAIDLFMKIMKSPPPPDLSSITLGMEEKPTLSDPRGSWSVEALPAKSKPKRPPRSTVEADVSSALLLRLIEAAQPSVSQDLTRSHISQIRLELEANRAASISTDGHRMTVTELPAVIPPEICGVYHLPLQVVKVAQAIAQKVPTVQVGSSKTGWTFRAGPHSLSITPTPVEFPPYKSVTPAPNRGPAVLLDSFRLLSALKQIDRIRRSLRQSEVPNVDMTVTSRQVLFSADKVTPQVQAVEVLDYRNLSEDPGNASCPSGVTVRFSLDYLLCAAKQVSAGHAWVECGGSLDPILLRPAGVGSGLVSGLDMFVVVMPMRT